MAKHKRSRHLAPRIFRAFARVLLAAGAILATGAIAMLILYFSNDQTLPFVTTTSSTTISSIPSESSVQTVYLLWSIIIIAVVVLGLIFVFRRLNAFVRCAICRIAKFLRVGIFATELYLSFVVWSISVILLSFFLPPIISVVFAGFLFTLTVYLFIIAWALYGCKKYKI